MWDEWRRASDHYSKFVHEKWGPSNCVNISRNLSKFARLSNNDSGSNGTTSRVDRTSSKRAAAGLSYDQEIAVEVEGRLIDEKEVLSFMFEKAEVTSPDSDDEDEKDNIFSKLETDNKTTDAQTNDVGPVVDASARQVCGYCVKVCFCSPGIRIKIPYAKSASSNGSVDASVTPRNNQYQLDQFQDEALNSIAKLCENKLVQHSDKFSISKVKYNYSRRAEQLVGSLRETFDLADQTGSSRREPWSEEQVKEILSVESLHDMFKATYSSPYDGEDRQATIEACSSNKKKKQNSYRDNPFLNKSFLENY